MQADRIVFVRGQVDRQREEPQVRTSEVIDVEDGKRRFSSALVIRLAEEGLDDAMLAALRGVLQRHRGPLPVYLELAGPAGTKTLIRTGEDLRVAVTADLQRDLENLLGQGHAVMTANGSGVMVRL